MVFSRLLFISLFGLLASCATVRDYPRCYLFRAPNTSDIEVADRDTKRLLADAISLEEFSVGKDAIVVNALPDRHRRLATVWSSYGCVNLRRPPPEAGEIHDKWIVSRCQDFLDELLKRDEVTPQIPRTTIANKYPDFTCH